MSTIKSILGFSFGPITLALLGIVNIPLLAWLFSPEDIGRLNILQMLCSFAMTAFSLGLDQAFIREYYARNNKPLLFLQCFLPVFCFFLVTCLVYGLMGAPILGKIFRIDGHAVIIASLLAMGSALALRFFSSILRMQNRGWVFSLCQIINRLMLITLCLFVYIYGVQPDFLILSSLFAISIFCAAAISAWFARKELYLAFSSRYTLLGFKSLAKFGLPLALSAFFYWGLTAAGTFSISHHSSLAQLGIYSVALSLGGGATIFQQIFTVIWAPTVYRWAEEGVEQSRFESVMKDALGMVSLLLCLVGVFFWAVDWFLPEAYSQVQYFLLCAVVPPVLYTLAEISSVGIGITRKTGLNVLATCLALIGNLLFNHILVPEYGAAGALTSAVLAHVIFFFLKTEFAFSAWHPMARTRLYITVIFFSAASVFTLYAGISGFEYMPVFWLLVLALVMMIYRRSYMEGLKKVLALRF